MSRTGYLWTHKAVSQNSTRDSESWLIQGTYGEDYLYLPFVNDSMATGNVPHTGIPLHEYRRDVPPGWGPGLQDYTLKTFFDRLKMWYRLYDGPDETVGPLVAGRLVGKAQTLALQLRLPRPDGATDVGSDALVRLPVDEVRDPSNPQVILQHHIPSGIQALCDKLRETFGHTDQEMASKSLEALFELRRGKLSLQEYAVEFDLRMEEAHERAGLEMNEVALFYFFFKNSGLPHRFVEDVKLQVHGDLRRYQEARSLALRMSTTGAGETFYQDMPGPSDEEWSWDHSYWAGDGWDDYGEEPLDPWSSWYEDDFYDQEYPEEEWQDDEFQVADEEGGDGSYPVKGSKGKGKKGRGNALGVGCSVCGSKWHDASACPVKSKGKGHGGHEQKGWPSKGKGYGKPRFGKGKGYGGYGKKGFKGQKGKFRTKGWRGYAEYPDDSYYQQSKSLVGHFGSDTYSAFPSSKQPSSKSTPFFDMAKDDHDFLGRRPTVTFEEPPADDEQPEEPEQKTTKNLDLHFPVSLYAEREHFHMIGGTKRRGLLVDPGASNGLIGSETLRDLLDECLANKEKAKVQWNYKTAQVSGISGAQDQTLGEVTVPVNFGSSGRGSFTADVLGGEGSLCPALLSNPALRKMSSVIFTDFFDNGDGLLACRAQSHETPGDSSSWSHFRLLLTDSGHYLLPVDKGKDVIPPETSSKATSFLQQTVKTVRNRWQDVRHCFYSAGSAELERSESFHVREQDCSVLRDPSESPVEDCSVPRDPSESPVEDCSVPCPQQSDFCDEGQVASLPKHPSVKGLYLLTQDDPLYLRQAQDEWTVFGDTLTRHHHVPRRTLFTPCCTTDCPVDVHLLTSSRETSARFRGESTVLRDSWKQVAHPHRDLAQSWTGVTKFKIKVPKAEQQVMTTAKEDDDAKFQELFKSYEGDEFPEHWNDLERKTAAQQYASVPEEFYSRTKRKPITPANFGSWFSRTRGRGLRWHMQELCSGSGRLSLVAVLSGLLVGFPVDYRYGWDLTVPAHQAMIAQAREKFLPAYLHASPSSTAWSNVSKLTPLRQTRRNMDAPMLSFLKGLFVEQTRQDLCFCVEQPMNSTMFQDKTSPLSDLCDLPGVRRRQQVDQCAHGCADEHGVPMKKATVIFGNLKMSRTTKRCNGHKGRAHSVPQGFVNGMNKAAKAMVYPRQMCMAMVEDVWKFVRTSQMCFTSWPSNLILHSFVGYKCERCQLGRAALPWMEHSLIPGECRHGRWPAGGGPRANPLRPADPVATFKRRAREKDLSEVVVETPADIFLPVQASLYFKYLMFVLVQDTVALFSEATERGIDYVHWVTDPVHKTMFQEIFQKELGVKAVACALRPFHCLVPEPHLSSRTAPLRLQISGTVKKWKVHELEDLRLLSHSQQHQKIDEVDWLITLFGSDPAGTIPSTPAGTIPSTPADTIPSTPAGAIPSTPSKASHRRKAPVDRAEDLPAPASQDKVEESIDDGDVQPEETFEGAPQQPIKPLYSFRKVFQRLVKIAESDPLTAKRLILGLHERFYHAPLGDLRNLLARCGMPPEVLNLVADAVKSCAVCRKFVRLPNRPQVKIGNSNVFNDRVQMDLFQYAGKWICLLVDESTRYKIAFMLADKGWKEITKMLLSTWMMYFGPPGHLVADQESSVMSHEASADLERFGITRCPRGTTSGAAGKQHTGTGLVERHVALTELTMRKLASELNRQGLVAEVDELAREAAMAQNLSLNFGGVTPAMAVFGTLPRPFFDVASDNVMVDAGALQTDLSQFERALRIRQTSMSCIQQAIAEDRVSRANRTRTHQLDMSTMVPGTTQVDIFREVAGDVGWRGPAELLKIDSSEGNAIVQYQGRPYLVGLRHLRLHEATSFAVFPPGVQDAVHDLRGMAEEQRPYKVSIVGWLLNCQDGQHLWRRASNMFPHYEDVMAKATLVARHLSDRPFGGIAFGQGVRYLRPPPHSIGILMFWSLGASQYASQEHWSSTTIKLKDLVPFEVESLCFVYLYYYHHMEDEPRPAAKIETESSTAPMELESLEPTMDSTELMDVKRKGPETRTVVLGPESKRLRTDLLVMAAVNETELEAERYLPQLHFMLSAQNRVKVDFQHQLISACNMPVYSLLDSCMMKHHYGNFESRFYDHGRPLVSWPGKKHENFLVDLHDGASFKVDTETDIIGEEDVFPIWEQVEEADKKELRQFIETKSFRCVALNTLSEDTVVIDATWVRKWKRKADGSIVVKSRLCARGCFDPHREHLTTRSTTATRLSQRIVLSTAACNRMNCESFDISGAFLKGFTFEKVRQLLRARGIVSPVRRVVVIPPPNVWRHLAEADRSFEVHGNFGVYGLACDKPVYGLNDAPLAWQLCLHEFLKKHGGVPSLMDENLFIWRTAAPECKLEALLSTHVDDLASAAKQAFLDWIYDTLKKEFGDVTRQTLPFDHCGCRYERVDDGYRMSQKHFAEKMVCAEVPDDRKDSDPLTAKELTSFRSVLGGLLWLTATRLDLIADVSLLQSKVTKACIEHLRQANKVVEKAKHPDFLDLGLHYRYLSGHFRLVCVHDASSANKDRNYAQEGILVLLCEDKLNIPGSEYKLDADDFLAERLGGKAHLLWSHGAKAKRVSYSTSHAETLSAIGGLETVSLVAVRLSELYFRGKPTLKDLTKFQESGNAKIPVDCLTDCRDFYELTTGDRTLPQDKGQRLYVLAHKEARINGRIRWMILVPTQSMVADALTKPMLAPQLLHLMSTGVVHYKNEEGHPILFRRLPQLLEYDEDTILESDDSLIKNFAWQRPMR